MSDAKDFGSFLKENKSLIKEYFEKRLEIYRLQGVRLFSKFAGQFIWIIIAVFLLFMFGIFAAIVLSLWFSKLTGSYIIGFGITTGIILLKIILITIFRKNLFINPVIRMMITNSNDELSENEE